VFAEWNADGIARIVREYEAALPKQATPTWVLGNHDQKRIASRVGVLGARTAAMLLLTLRGTPTIYYGDELGLENVLIPPDRVQDPWEKHEPGVGLGRDPARTPMPWDGSPNAGFTAGTPWLPLGPDHAVRNVAALATESQSILNLYRRLIALRREHAALSGGSLFAVRAYQDVLTFERSEGDTQLFIALNFADEQRRVELPTDANQALALLSTYLDRDNEHVQVQFELRPSEGIILKLSGAERQTS
jgi:alpha-glucosidase